MFVSSAGHSSKPAPYHPGPAAAQAIAAAHTRGTTATSNQAAVASDTSHAALRDRLLALGLPTDIVRSVIVARVAEPRLARQRAIYVEAAKKPWWQGGHTTHVFTAEERREFTASRKAEREELARLLGPGADLSDNERERFAYLPPDKAERLAQLERDYNELRAETSGENSEERRKLLKAEYERDLDALLTPEERGLLAQRDSTTARQLANRLQYFTPTDEEYQKLFALQKAYDDKFPMQGGASLVAMDAARARSDARRQLETDLQAALGAQRAADWLRSQRPEHRTLVEMQRRFNLPATTVEQVAQIPQSTSTRGYAILDDGKLSPDEKRAALSRLAEESRTQIRSSLGAELGNVYLNSNAATWINQLDNGRVSGQSPTGGIMTRSVPTRTLSGAMKGGASVGSPTPAK